MKLQRYDIDTGQYGDGYKAIEDDWAEWVRSDDVEKLEEQNREMYNILKSLCESCELGFYDTKNSDPRDVLPCTECGAKAIIARISEWEGE